MAKKISFLTVLLCLGANSAFAADSTSIPECDRFVQYSEQLIGHINNPELTEKVQTGIVSLKEQMASSKTKEQKEELSQICAKAFTLLNDAITK